jgi:hypothetical protein
LDPASMAILVVGVVLIGAVSRRSRLDRRASEARAPRVSSGE